MSSIKLPADSSNPNYNFKSDVNGVTYKFSLVFNNRSNKWYITVGTEEGDDILAGIPVLADTPLLTAVVAGLPEQILFALNVNIKKESTNEN